MFFGKKTSPEGKNISKQITVNTPPAKKHPLKAEILRLAWFALALSLLLCLLSYAPTDPSWTTWTSKSVFKNWLGRSGSVISDVLFQLFGLAAFMVAAIFALFAFTKNRFHTEERENSLSLFSPVLFLLSLSAFLQSFWPQSLRPWSLANSGGVTGSLLHGGLRWAAGDLGAFLISLFCTIGFAMWVFRWNPFSHVQSLLKRFIFWTKLYTQNLKTKFKTSLSERKTKLLERLKTKTPLIAAGTTPALATATQLIGTKPVQLNLPNTEVKPVTLSNDHTPPIETVRSAEDDEVIKALNPELGKEKVISKPKPVRKFTTAYSLPSLNMLSGKADSKIKPVDKNWYLEKAQILVEKLRDFGVEGEVVHISPGPVITVYEFKPASGVKIKEISNLSDDLTLALSVLSVRIVAPIPGKPVVGIEIPSPHRETVFFKDMVQETPFFKPEIRIPVALGRLASGEPVTADLAAMPHLLVAGTTGTGKSVFINSLISSLLYRFTPQQLKLILVDPKMVELSHYEGIPHLLLPVVVDSKKAVLALRWAVEEMERRYTLMHHFGVRHVDSYNEKLNESTGPSSNGEHPFLPYMVVVIDEYADLMAVVPKDVEHCIARLAQKARASGIHLVIATQRPSTDVVTGTIKANFPSRISFRVASSIDSKTILDRTGADRLLGNGDMLFHSAGFTSLKRMQGAFISEQDTSRVVDYLKSQGEPDYDQRIMKTLEAADQDPTESGPSSDSSDEDAKLFDAAVRLVTERGEASISLVQRHLRIGYNRAATLIEELEKQGIIGPSAGASKRRTVLVGQI